MTKEGIEAKIAAEVDKLSPDKVFVVTDSVVDRVADGFLADYPRIVIPAGELNKNLDTLAGIWKELSLRGATRRSMVVNLGGGMVSDTGGFAAATFKRGIEYGNIPTTLLAAVDAAIGGKTGVNFSGFKNEIGAFKMPRFTIPLIDTFSSLPDTEMLSGYGEMLKTGLLISRQAFDTMTEERFLDVENPDFHRLVEECGHFKEKVVAEDPTEKGLRKILNLGHTFGHAFESLLLERGKPVAHGIAVAHGILASLILSRLVFDNDPEILYRYSTVLKNCFPSIPIGCDDTDRLLFMMGHDKKNGTDGRPRFVLLRKAGEPEFDIEVEESLILSAFEIYLDMAR